MANPVAITLTRNQAPPRTDSPFNARMRLLFDHGTLVLAEAPDLPLDFVPGLMWDPRVALFRAPAWRYGEMVRALRYRGVPFVDEARPPPPDTDPGTTWSFGPISAGRCFPGRSAVGAASSSCQPAAERHASL